MSDSPASPTSPTPPAPGISPASLVYTPANYLDRLRWTEVFPLAQPVEIELGSGDGSFLAQYAQAHPDRNYLGVERLLGRLRKLDRKGLRAGLRNLRLFRIEAAYFLAYLVPAQSVRALHVYFPDPWPKRRHQRRRLVNAAFAAAAWRALGPGGPLYLRTDDASYGAQMREVCGGHPGFEAIETPPELAAIQTDFEREFRAQGVPVCALAYRRRTDPAD